MSYLFVTLGGALSASLVIFVSQLMPLQFGKMSVKIIDSFVKRIAFVKIGAKVASKEAVFLTIGILDGFNHIFCFFVERTQALGGG